VGRRSRFGLPGPRQTQTAVCARPPVRRLSFFVNNKTSRYNTFGV
jgi:hypothetical protein